MEPFTKHPRPLGLTLILLLGIWGCAHTPNPDMPGTWKVTYATSSWRQALSLGAPVGLATHGHVLDLMGAKPATREQGADDGARAVRLAIGSTLRFAGGDGDPSSASGHARRAAAIYLVGPIAVSMLVPATLAGVGVGALSQPSAGQVAAGEAGLTQTWEALQSSTVLQQYLVAASQERQGPRLVPVPEPFLNSPRSAIDQSGGSPAAMKTILLVLGPRAHLGSTEGTEAMNPRLALELTVGIRLLHRTDGSVLYDAQLTKKSGVARTFTAWAANDAKPLREETDRALAALAKEILDHLFGTETF